MIHQVLVAAPTAHEEGQLADQVELSIPKRGQAIAGNSRKGGLAIDPGRGPTTTVRPSLTSLTPSRVYKLAQQPRMAEYSQQQRSALPSPPSRGELALQEVISTTTTRLLPPYPCIGHHSPPSPSAASFQHASSRELLDRTHPWPSKGLACRCLW